MRVEAEVRTNFSHETRIKEGLEAEPAPSAKPETPGLLYGRVKVAGLHPQLVPCIPSPEMFKSSCHYPLFVSNSPFAKQTVDGVTDVSRNIEGINTRVVEFESEMAYGKTDINIKGVKSSRPELFLGKKRFVQVAVQAQFKVPVKASSLCIGQELYNDVAIPLWMRQLFLTTAAKAFSSTARVEVEGTPRYFMNPVLACCQLMNVSQPGEEPELWEAEEDMRLLIPAAVDSNGRPLTSDKRRKFCDVPAHVESVVFQPGLVYTFHFWQHYADFGDYRLGLGWLNLDLSVFQNRSPLQLTVKCVDSGRYAFSIMAWHERLLYSSGATKLIDGGAAEAEQQLRRSSGGGCAAPPPGAGVGARLFSGFSRMLGGAPRQ